MAAATLSATAPRGRPLAWRRRRCGSAALDAAPSDRHGLGAVKLQRRGRRRRWQPADRELARRAGTACVPGGRRRHQRRIGSQLRRRSPVGADRSATSPSRTIGPAERRLLAQHDLGAAARPRADATTASDSNRIDDGRQSELLAD